MKNSSPIWLGQSAHRSQHAVALRAARSLSIILAICLLTGWSWPAPQVVAPTHTSLRIDPNRAPAAELRLLPGIGPRMAEAIIRYREQIPGVAFQTPTDLDRVPRIGPATVERLTPFLALPEADSQ